MTDPGHADPRQADPVRPIPIRPRVWTDRSFLRDVQYKTGVNLAARQSISAYQRRR